MKLDMLGNIHDTVRKFMLWYGLENLEEDGSGK